jgi:peptidyl-dipeptidase A
MRTLVLRLTVPAVLALLTGCTQSKPTADDAKKFLDDAQAKLNDLGIEAGRAAWVQEIFITDDTEALSAASGQRSGDEAVRLAKEAKKFDDLQLAADAARMMKLLKTSFTLAPPSDPKESAEVSKIAASMDATYGKGKYCKPAQGSAPATCLDINDITKIMATSTNPAELLDVWKGWHTISPPMRKDFTRFVELSNKGAVELGFKDTGAMWRSKYDMPADDFSKELDRLWDQVRPLYLSLHAYVRTRLHEKYGNLVP